MLKCFARRGPGGRWTAEERLRMPVPVRARAEKARRNGSFPPRFVRSRHMGAADGTRPKARLVLWTRRALPVQKQAFGTGSAWWRRASAGCPNRRCPRLGGCRPDTPRGAPTPHFTFKNFPSASKSPVVPRKPVTNVTALPPRFRLSKAMRSSCFSFGSVSSSSSSPVLY